MLRTSDFILQISYFIFHTSYFTFHISHLGWFHTSSVILHIPHFIFHTWYFILHISHFRFHTLHFTLHILHFRVHTSCGHPSNTFVSHFIMLDIGPTLYKCYTNVLRLLGSLRQDLLSICIGFESDRVRHSSIPTPLMKWNVQNCLRYEAVEVTR